MSEEKKYEFRTIEADDIGYVTELIAKLDADNIAECFKKGDNLEVTGVKIALAICKNYKAAQKDIYALLARLSSLPEDEIAHMPASNYIKMIKALFEEPEVVEAFKVASSFAE